MRTREDLIAAFSSGPLPPFVYFWRAPEPGAPVSAACLSQWASSPFTHEGDTFRTAEHFMMAGKARLFGDEATRVRILTAQSPAEVQRLGRQVKPFDGPTWERARTAIVTEGSVLKFRQNPAMGAWLLATGERVLVEASPVDRIWGIGLAADDGLAADPRAWKGLNLLGFCLMEARRLLRAERAALVGDGSP